MYKKNVKLVISVLGTTSTSASFAYFSAVLKLPYWESGIFSSVLGLVVLLLLTSFLVHLPTRSFLGRKMLLDGSELEGLWLECLNRHGEKNYTIFKFDWFWRDQCYVMYGDSHFLDGGEHSDWTTTYLEIRIDGTTRVVEYIYSATNSKLLDPDSKGYGRTTFLCDPVRGDIRDGKGYYIATEEDSTPMHCTYVLYKIDKEFLGRVGIGYCDLKCQKSKEEFIKKIHIYFTNKNEADLV